MTKYDIPPYKGPDPEIDGDLMDETWDPADEPFFELEDADSASPSRRRMTRWQTVAAIVTLISLVCIGLGHVMDVLRFPTIDFLQRSRQLHQDPLIQHLRNAVVEIQTSGRGFSPSSGQGTGFNIDPSGLIVTNRHVIENAGLVAVTFHGKAPMYAREWIIHPGADLALIHLNGIALPTLPLQTVPPPVGTPVFIIGNPLGFSSTVMEGTVRSYVRMSQSHRLNSNMTIMEIEAPIHPGSSGSPVINQKGEVIGVVYAQIVGRQDRPPTGLAIPVQELQNFLNLLD